VPELASSVTNKDFTIALELDGHVYKTVLSVVVKSCFAFKKVLAI
jgi:hypothetical protein